MTFEKFTQKRSAYLPLGLFLFGVLLRTAGLGTVPGGFQMDEAYSSWLAYSLYHSGIDSAGYSYPVYFEAWGHGMNALNSYLMLPFIALNGGHVSLLTARLPQFLVSVASLAAIYFASKKMFSPQTACWTLFVTAIFPWHLMMSHWGLESNLAPGFLLIAFTFFLYGLERPGFLLLSALCYGLSLYCYATIWPMLPVMLLAMVAYCLWTKKLKCSRMLLLSAVVLAISAFPLVAFLLVNMEVMEGFRIGPFSVYRMTMFRGHELASSLSDVVSNLKTLLYLFYHQNVGRPYDVIMPYGFFYDIGRVFIFFGILAVLRDTFCAFFCRKEFSYSVLLFFQLFGALLVALMLPVNMTQINCVYLPLMLCEGLGIVRLGDFLWNRFLAGRGTAEGERAAARKRYSAVCTVVLTVAYLLFFAGFETRYFTDYRELADAYYQQGTHEAVKKAFACAKERNCDVWINDALKYPNVLLATETTGREYLDSVVYSEHLPAPESFKKDGVTFHLGYDANQISYDQIYLLYENELDAFRDSFELTAFHHWYVALPLSK